MTHGNVDDETRESLLVAVYDNETSAQRAIEKLNAKGFAMDMLSVLGRAHPSGDDVLGIYYTSMGARMEAWAKQGALWGALWGLLSGAAAMFVLPGLGAVLAAGPIVEAMVGVLGGGVMGAAVGGAAMTGAAAVSHLARAMHRMGIPQQQLDRLHSAIEEGHYVLLLRAAGAEIQPWKALLDSSGAHEILELPYTGVRDAI